MGREDGLNFIFDTFMKEGCAVIFGAVLGRPFLVARFAKQSVGVELDKSDLWNRLSSTRIKLLRPSESFLYD